MERLAVTTGSRECAPDDRPRLLRHRAGIGGLAALIHLTGSAFNQNLSMRLSVPPHPIRLPPEESFMGNCK
jgi:hypothetical protein